MDTIQMVDLKGQYEKIKDDINAAIFKVIENTAFIQGPDVKILEERLQGYLGSKRVVTCANGTDALQIALMALDLKAGDEVIVPSFTYVATAEVIGLLGLVPVMVDVDPNTFNITPDKVAAAITDKTKAIVPVHIFGQCVDMEPIMDLVVGTDIKIIEDTAQAIGSLYTFSNGTKKSAGTMGDIGCTSFFPSKNLGCYGDGGALYTDDQELGATLKMIANHGQRQKYFHEVLGVNSRLDTLQAAVLNVKLTHLDRYSEARNKAASFYDAQLKEIEGLVTPVRAKNSTHVFHQYTLRVTNGRRDELQQYLKKSNIPTMVYYPVPLFEQQAFQGIGRCSGNQDVTKMLCQQVLSLPMHTELDNATLEYIVKHIKSFFNG